MERTLIRREKKVLHMDLVKILKFFSLLIQWYLLQCSVRPFVKPFSVSVIRSIYFSRKFSYRSGNSYINFLVVSVARLRDLTLLYVYRLFMCVYVFSQSEVIIIFSFTFIILWYHTNVLTVCNFYIDDEYVTTPVYTYIY